MTRIWAGMREAYEWERTDWERAVAVLRGRVFKPDPSGRNPGKRCRTGSAAPSARWGFNPVPFPNPYFPNPIACRIPAQLLVILSSCKSRFRRSDPQAPQGPSWSSANPGHPLIPRILIRLTLSRTVLIFCRCLLIFPA